MREHRVTLPDIVLIGATRAVLGFGAGLLISDRLQRHRRKSLGLTLLISGVLSTIPIALHVFRGRGTDHQRSPQARPAIVTE